MPFSADVSIEELVSLIKDKKCTGASINGWCREAALEVLRENIDNKEIEMRHFLKAFEALN